MSVQLLQANPTTLPLIDVAIIERLEAMIGSDVIERVSSVFASEVRLSLREIALAQSQSNWVMVARVAHRLRGGARQVGAEHLATLCRHLIESPRDQAALAAFPVVAEATISALEQHLNQR